MNTLLDFSRIEAGRITARYRALNLGEFTSELASVFRSAMEKAGLRYIVDCDGSDRPVYVDPEMWEKIVLNLISNAFKFTLSGEVQGDAQICATGKRSSALPTPARVSRSSELPRIFDRFHRVEGAIGRTHEGTGIGLALVSELARLHGGVVQVRSTFGSGICIHRHHSPGLRSSSRGQDCE